ncbi:hypothetical protein C1645_758230 [Glomus cerebriforme]|uniref:Uncharacterized protein n=1 Tax=Glomus cerebriforme TaxID=658196 RepID=A0A397TJD6_9GLOM|nr:hypothetical protein C1645_758230 [Glomus cerebriforme]
MYRTRFFKYSYWLNPTILLFCVKYKIKIFILNLKEPSLLLFCFITNFCFLITSTFRKLI